MHRFVFEEPGPDSELYITETGKALVGLLFSLAVFATLAVAFWIAS